jgi:hypothetical protein
VGVGEAEEVGGGEEAGVGEVEEVVTPWNRVWLKLQRSQ